MRVCVNTLLITADKCGVKTFVLHLLRALCEVDRRNDYVYLCGRHNVELFDREPFRGAERVRLEVLGLSSPSALARTWYDQFVVPRAVARYPGSILFTPGVIPPLRSPVPQVVLNQAPMSVRRVRFEVPPEARPVSMLRCLYYDLLMPSSLRACDRFITVSDYFARRLLRQYPFSRRKVSVIESGIDLDRFSGNGDGARTRNEQTEPYVLFAATLFPYKKAGNLLRAFGSLHASGAIDPRLRLKMAGKDPDGRQRPRLEALARELSVADRVDWLGLVPLEDMPELYRGALLFAFPSSVETFGLPVLEAMSCGVPVVASNRMSVPEVTGDAGVIVDPDDVPALAEAVRRVATDDGLRTDLIRRGRQRAAELTWRRAARRLCRVFDELGGSARAGAGGRDLA